jgi:single-strand DNA-binding protein
MGRLTRDPETRYSQGAEPMAITRYTLAVNRRTRKENEQQADFINCVAFGRAGEFAQNYFKKGMLVAVSGRLQITPFDDANGVRKWFTDVILDDQHFAESKGASENRGGSMPHDEYLMPPSYNPGGGQGPGQGSSQPALKPPSDGFFTLDESLDDDDLPF